MIDDIRIVRFDWAIKRMLRDKANFDVLEGLITVLLGEQVYIVELLESESNQDDPFEKLNRVEVKAKNSKEEIILAKIQLTRELYYLERILYGVAKTITEHIDLGQKYDQVKKVYSISILYFDLGRGSDYLYHGTTTFRGVHTGDVLEISTKDRDAIRMRRPSEIFPEYFIIRVNEFNNVATTPLEEWLDYLKNDHIKADTTAPGLQAARKKLQYLQMDSAERRAYDRHVDNVMVQNDVLDTARDEGRAEGRAEGEKAKALDIAKKMKSLGLAEDIIGRATGLTEEQIHAL